MKKFLVDQHIRGKHYVNKRDKKYNQAAAGTLTKPKKQKFYQDKVLAFSSANIPLYKLQFPTFKHLLDKYMLPEFQQNRVLEGSKSGAHHR